MENCVKCNRKVNKGEFVKCEGLCAKSWCFDCIVKFYGCEVCKDIMCKECMARTNDAEFMICKECLEDFRGDG